VTGRTRLALGTAVFCALLIGLLLWTAPSLYEVVDEGHDLRPYDSGKVYELRIADSITIYADEESKQSADVVTAVAMVVLATAAGMTALLLGAAGASGRLRLFYALAALGLGWLAFDELMGVHETVGHNLPFLADVPGVERPDDLLFALYSIPAIVFVVVFRDVIWRARGWFAAGIGLMLAAGASDVAGLSIDEPLEVLVIVCLLVGFISLIVTDLAGGLRLNSLGGRTSPPYE
jgi:hypothetical protein